MNTVPFNSPAADAAVRASDRCAEVDPMYWDNEPDEEPTPRQLAELTITDLRKETANLRALLADERAELKRAQSALEKLATALANRIQECRECHCANQITHAEEVEWCEVQLRQISES